MICGRSTEQLKSASETDFDLVNSLPVISNDFEAGSHVIPPGSRNISDGDNVDHTRARGVDLENLIKQKISELANEIISSERAKKCIMKEDKAKINQEINKTL